MTRQQPPRTFPDIFDIESDWLDGAMARGAPDPEPEDRISRNRFKPRPHHRRPTREGGDEP